MNNNSEKQSCGTTRTLAGGISEGIGYPEDVRVEITPVHNHCVGPDNTVELIFIEPKSEARSSFPTFNHKFFLQKYSAEKLAGLLLEAASKLHE